MYERSNSVVNFDLFIDTRIDDVESGADVLPFTLHEFPVLQKFNTIDMGLNDIQMKPIENKDTMPLVKEELRNRIQLKRLNEGKEELILDLTEQPKTELTDEEKEKVERRRVQNRMAARRFREKEKALGAKLQKTTQNLESVNTSLRTQIRELRKECQILHSQLTEHLSDCPKVKRPRIQPSFPL
ncbi:hypothetical protein ACJMK2_007867 [Sinanodonta woodiana]|uniref:BZIP domain-containing protein n=1 Tax=Sinanodonta woodiana TaxID=1069815 RepID=A0ABD3VMT3_SINWO